MPIVELENIYKIYTMGDTEVRALDGVSLSFEQGEYAAIMGPSGSGKSTLLNVLGCLDRPTTGRYFLGGQDVSKMNDDELSAIRSRRLGFIFQSYNLIPQLSVLENIEVPLYYQGLAEAESKQRATELAEMVGLKDRLHHRPPELSGGQQQRAAIARSLANEPLMLLADEPTGNLDSHTEAEILELMDKLNADGKTILIVTHDDHVAGRASRTIRMKDGCVHSEVEH